MVEKEAYRAIPIYKKNKQIYISKEINQFDIEQEGVLNMTVRDLYIYSRDGHTFILYKEGATKSCFKGSLEDCPTELIDKLVYQFRAIDFNTIEVILIG